MKAGLRKARPCERADAPHAFAVDRHSWGTRRDTAVDALVVHRRVKADTATDEHTCCWPLRQSTAHLRLILGQLVLKMRNGQLCQLLLRYLPSILRYLLIETDLRNAAHVIISRSAFKGVSTLYARSEWRSMINTSCPTYFVIP